MFSLCFLTFILTNWIRAEVKALALEAGIPVLDCSSFTCFLNLYILVFAERFSRPPEEDLGWLKMFQLPKVFGTSVDYKTITIDVPFHLDCASVRQVDEAGRSYIIGQRFRPSLEP